MELLVAISILGVILTLGMFIVLRKISAPAGRLPLTAEWIDELSLERYRPMMRLLESDDIEFLRSQPGFTSRMAAKLRAQRAQIFCGYLRCLSADFGRVCAALKLVMVQCRYDRPDLGQILLRQQATFVFGLLSAYGRLALYRLGFCSVDVTGLVKIFEATRLELRNLVPAASAMPA